MTSAYCDKVKQRSADVEDFDDFMKHISDCHDCQRRIRSQIIVDFKTRQMGDK